MFTRQANSITGPKAVNKVFIAALVLLSASTANAQGNNLSTEPSPREVYESVSDLFYNWKAVVGRVDIDMQALHSDFKQTDFKVAGSYDERLARAEVAFLLKDYHGSSLALYGLADKATFAKEAGFDKALYYLAESLYQVENYLSLIHI